MQVIPICNAAIASQMRARHLVDSIPFINKNVSWIDSAYSAESLE